MANKLGQVKIKFRNEDVDAVLYDSGEVMLPDGKKIKLKDAQFSALKEQLEKKNQKKKEVSPMVPYSAPPKGKKVASPTENYANVQGFQNVQGIDAFQQYDKSAEERYVRKKRMKIFIGIIVALMVVAAALGLIRAKYPELLGLAPNSYKVAVANDDIASGATISTEQIRYIELSRDEYTAMCTEMYMAEDGSMKADSPIFFVNANNQIAGRFAAEAIHAGEVIRPSMVTTQIYQGEITIDGEKQTMNMTESQMNGQTDIEIVAKIKDASGNEQEILITKMKLQGKNVAEMVSGNGEDFMERIGQLTDVPESQVEDAPESEPAVEDAPESTPTGEGVTSDAE